MRAVTNECKRDKRSDKNALDDGVDFTILFDGKDINCFPVGGFKITPLDLVNTRVLGETI